ncbi:MAG: hypothetical protein ABMB14_14390, partial [Myxococcota bacterium]
SEPALVQAIRSGAGGGSGADRASALRAAVAFGCALSDPEREALELAIRDAVTDLGSAGPEIGFVAAGLGHVALYLGRTDDAIALLTAGVDGLAADGTPAEQAIAGIDLAAALRVAGRLPDAHRALAACPAGSADVLRGYEQGRLAVTEGRAAEATVALERALVGASEPWPRLGILRWLVRARAAAGDPAGAAGWSAQLEREARAVIGPARPAALALIAEAGRPVAPTDLVY